MVQVGLLLTLSPGISHQDRFVICSSVKLWGKVAGWDFRGLSLRDQDRCFSVPGHL